MPEYAVVFARSARKELQALDPAVAARILKRVEALATNPRPTGVVKLEGLAIYGVFGSANGELFIAYPTENAWLISLRFGIVVKHIARTWPLTTRCTPTLASALACLLARG